MVTPPPPPSPPTMDMKPKSEFGREDRFLLPLLAEKRLPEPARTRFGLFSQSAQMLDRLSTAFAGALLASLQFTKFTCVFVKTRRRKQAAEEGGRRDGGTAGRREGDGEKSERV